MIEMVVGDLHVEVVRKDIKNLHVGVYPPDGRVRVAAPHRLTDEAIRMAVITRIGWIRKQKRQFAEKTRVSPREYVERESHFFMGRRYLLEVVEGSQKQTIEIVGNKTLRMNLVGTETTTENRQRFLDAWYRQNLREHVRDLVPKWEEAMGVEVRDWRIRKMKTRWGSCSIDAGRVWLNLELAKKPQSCIEYILVHEMVHLIERKHNDRFRKLMDRYLPQWRQHREELNQYPLKHEDWRY